MPNVVNDITAADSKASINTKLSDLNEDCQLLIFKYLSLSDQISMMCSHYSFEAAFKSYAKIYYKNFNTGLLWSISLSNIQQLFIVAGEYIKQITINLTRDHDRAVDICFFIQYNCPNLHKLEVLTMEENRCNMPNLCKIFTNKRHLTDVSFVRLLINEHCILAMKEISTLDHLSITDCENFKGRYLYMLTQLKALRLAYCPNLKSRYIRKAISAMPSLKALGIIGCTRVSDSVTNALSNKNPNLQSLFTSSFGDSVDNIANLPKLRCLGLYGNVSTSLLQSLVDKRSDQLESLIIYTPRSEVDADQCELIAKLKNLKTLEVCDNPGINDYSLSAFSELVNLVNVNFNYATNITNSGLLKLVSNCPKLKYVDVQFTGIDNDFAEGLLSIIRQRKRETVPLVVLVAGSNIYPCCDILKEYHRSDIKSKVEIEFDLVPCDNASDWGS